MTARGPASARRPGGESEATWYSRLAIWVGAAILLLQAITGRGEGLMTAIAVLLLCVGLVVFLGSLAADARLPEARAASSPETAAVDAAPATDAGPAVRSVEGRETEASGEESATPPPQADAAVVTATSVQPAVELEPVRPASAEPRTPVAAPIARVATVELQAGDPLVESACRLCRRPLSVGEVAAICPVCGGPHHATCWVAQRFSCATPGCVGTGSLEAPGEDASPGGGPSKP